MIRYFMKHVVKYRDSERGWGSETWYTPYDSYEEALEKVNSCNAKNSKSEVPDYYIQAEYIGILHEDEIPEGYKN